MFFLLYGLPTGHSRGVMLPQIGALQIRQVHLHRQGVLLKGKAQSKAAAPDRVIKAAHGCQRMAMASEGLSRRNRSMR